MENDDSFTKKINLFRKLSFYLVMRTFKSEIDEEMRLDMKYNLSRTKDEMEKVKLFINKYIQITKIFIKISYHEL